MRKCLICENVLIIRSCWPTCSPICFWILTEALNHWETPCWISAEVYCRNGYCVSFVDGIRQECEIFKTERIINEQGLNKAALIGNY